MSERKLRRMSRTELIDVIDTLRQEETPQDTEALRRVDAERERLTERRRFWRVLRGTVSTLIVVAAIAVLLATLLLPVLQVSGDSMNPTLQDRDVILLVKTDDWKTGRLVWLLLAEQAAAQAHHRRAGRCHLHRHQRCRERQWRGARRALCG